MEVSSLLRACRLNQSHTGNRLQKLKKRACLVLDLTVVGGFGGGKVHPSHVDVRTQGTFQTMDPHFVGLIFSTFNHVRSGQNIMSFGLHYFVSTGPSMHSQTGVSPIHSQRGVYISIHACFS